MNKNIVKIATLGATIVMLAACTQQTVPQETIQPTPSPAAMAPDASISGQIDISDDAVTQKEAAPKMDNDEDSDE
ncbi:MAG: hypothetical protein M3Q44_04145 [bacterium]|nr:hypothetical protein [bacterium]